jgi:putative ABC transport system substrate-binding protein
MKRRDTILALLALGATARSSIAIAQPAKPPRRIATLDDSSESSRAREWAALRKRLQELGYTESNGFFIEGRFARAQAERLPALAAELVALMPDVIVTASTPAALAAKRATSSIPIVSIAAVDPVKAGLVKSFARPEGNLTGTSIIIIDVVGKWLELLRELSPKVKSVVLLTSADNPGSMQTFRELQERAKPLGMAVQMLDGRNRSNVERAFETMAREHVDALIVTAAGVLMNQRQQIVEAAARLRIPAMYARREYPDAGGLMSYGADYDALFVRAADYVHRILQGAKPADLPFERASVFRLVVNAKALNALGLKIPESVRVRVDEVIR